MLSACNSPQAQTHKTSKTADSLLAAKQRLNALMEDFTTSYADTTQRRVIVGRIQSEFPDFIPGTLSYDEIMPSVLSSRLEQYNRHADQKIHLK